MRASSKAASLTRGRITVFHATNHTNGEDHKLLTPIYTNRSVISLKDQRVNSSNTLKARPCGDKVTLVF